MKIIYNENPLNSVVLVDENDVEKLRLKIKIDELENRLIDVNFCLRDGRIEDAKKIVAYEDSNSLDGYVNLQLHYYLDALSDKHVGDCTCVACSCIKCMAEYYLDIDTIKGLGKHEAHYVFCAFGESPDNGYKSQRNIDEAIEYLENYKPDATWKGWEAHADRWLSEAHAAAEWLKNYRNQHFK